MALICGCAPTWLTSASVPVTAEQATKEPCPCCGAPAAKRCHGGSAGWINREKGEAYVDVCPARLEVQRTLL